MAHFVKRSEIITRESLCVYDRMIAVILHFWVE